MRNPAANPEGSSMGAAGAFGTGSVPVHALNDAAGHPSGAAAAAAAATDANVEEHQQPHDGNDNGDDGCGNIGGSVQEKALTDDEKGDDAVGELQGGAADPRNRNRFSWDGLPAQVLKELIEEELEKNTSEGNRVQWFSKTVVADFQKILTERLTAANHDVRYLTEVSIRNRLNKELPLDQRPNKRQRSLGVHEEQEQKQSKREGAGTSTAAGPAATSAGAAAAAAINAVTQQAAAAKQREIKVEPVGPAEAATVQPLRESSPVASLPVAEAEAPAGPSAASPAVSKGAIDQFLKNNAGVLFTDGLLTAAVGVALTSAQFRQDLYDRVIRPAKQAAEDAARSKDVSARAAKEALNAVLVAAHSITEAVQRAQDLATREDLAAVTTAATAYNTAAANYYVRGDAADADKTRADQLMLTATDLERQFKVVERFAQGWATELGGNGVIAEMPVTRHWAREEVERMIEQQPQQQWAAIVAEAQQEDGISKRDAMDRLCSAVVDLPRDNPIAIDFEKELFRYLIGGGGGGAGGRAAAGRRLESEGHGPAGRSRA